MTVNTRFIQTFLCGSGFDLSHIPLTGGLRVQLLPDITFLARCQKHHFAAFIQQPPCLVVWDDDPAHIISRAEGIEKSVISMIWDDPEKDAVESGYKSPSTMPGRKSQCAVPSVRVKEVSEKPSDEENVAYEESPRPTAFTQAIYTAITAVIVTYTIGLGWRRVATEIKTDHNWARLGLLIVVPFQYWTGWVRKMFPYGRNCMLTPLSFSSKALSTVWPRYLAPSIKW